MKIGFQTVSWGRRLEDGGKRMLQSIRESGYQGVEIAQHPSALGSAKQTYELLKRCGLKLLGLSGGSVKERGAFLGELIHAENKALVRDKGPIKKVIRSDDNCPYIYVDTWESEQCRELMAQHYTLALHPHMFKPIQTAKEARKLLTEHPELCFLPDTAHLTVAGDTAEEVLNDNYDRIAAIHLKDWTSEFGRSYQYYSRGFSVRFGEGEVQLAKIVEFLRSKAYKGWVVVEQDVVGDPAGAAHDCIRWLKAHSI